MPLIDTPSLLLMSQPGGPAIGLSRSISPLSLLLSGGLRPTISLPYDLIAAVVTALGGSSPTSLLPGGAHEGFAGQFAGAATGRPVPYANVFDVSESPAYNSGLGYWADGTLQINVFNITRVSARQTADAIAAILNDNPLVFQVGTLKNLRQSGRYTQKDPDPGPGSKPLFMESRMFSYSLWSSIL